MESVFQNEKKCFACGKDIGLNSHHIFPGSRRKNSERYGFKVWLCTNHHTIGKDSVHENPNTGLDLKLKRMAQDYWETHYGNRKSFIETFGKNYL